MSTEKNYPIYIAMSGIILLTMTTIQTRFVLDHDLQIHQYIIPVLLAVVFGVLLARIKTSNDRLQEIAGTDPLTGLCNRRSLEKNITVCIDNYKRHGIKFSVLIFDIDDFKAINDTYGHQDGDRVLVSISDILKSSSRAADFCARWGGEEFIIVLPNEDINGAINKAEKLRIAIESTVSSPAKITCSFGVSDCQTEGASIENIIKRADAALYHAKFMGKNRVEFLEAA